MIKDVEVSAFSECFLLVLFSFPILCSTYVFQLASSGPSTMGGTVKDAAHPQGPPSSPLPERAVNMFRPINKPSTDESNQF